MMQHGFVVKALGVGSRRCRFESWSGDNVHPPSLKKQAILQMRFFFFFKVPRKPMTKVLHAYIHLLHNSVQKKRKNNVHVLYNRVEGWQRTISTFFFFTTVCKGAAYMEQRERERERERESERERLKSQMQFWFHAWQGIFLPEPAFTADYFSEQAQPLCATACINICAHAKNPKH